jgi:hypothetical protein
MCRVGAQCALEPQPLGRPGLFAHCRRLGPPGPVSAWPVWRGRVRGEQDRRGQRRGRAWALSAHRFTRRRPWRGLRWSGAQGPDLTPQSLRIARPSLLKRVALAVVRCPESAACPASALASSLACDARPSRRVRSASLADIVDKGAFTGRLGYAHPTAAPGSARSPSNPADLSQGRCP